jgi:hypothetical protein
VAICPGDRRGHQVVELTEEIIEVGQVHFLFTGRPGAPLVADVLERFADLGERHRRGDQGNDVWPRDGPTGISRTTERPAGQSRTIPAVAATSAGISDRTRARFGDDESDHVTTTTDRCGPRVG